MSALHLTKVQRAQYEAIATVLDRWGLAHDIVNEGPHLQVRIHGPKGGVWRCGIAGTPRNPESAPRLATANAKRIVREINVRLGLA